jgi:hypothetical protein
LLRAKVAVGIQHAWWLKSDRIDRLKGAKWSVSAEISQISELDDIVNLFLYLLEK